MEIKVVENKQQFNDALKVRREVFIDEQQVPEEEEIDQYEDICTHVVVYDEANPVAAGRLREYDQGVGKMERICVLSSYRGKGLGKIVMDKLEEISKEKGYSKLKLNAQTHAEGFYSKIGYETVSDIFMDAGIPHVTMVKNM